jgi:hypothetical protein
MAFKRPLWVIALYPDLLQGRHRRLGKMLFKLMVTPGLEPGIKCYRHHDGNARVPVLNFDRIPLLLVSKKTRESVPPTPSRSTQTNNRRCSAIYTSEIPVSRSLEFSTLESSTTASTRCYSSSTTFGLVRRLSSQTFAPSAQRWIPGHDFGKQRTK